MNNKIVLKTPENKIIIVDTNTDPQLYAAPVNPPNTGTTYTTGEDLYAHKAKSGNIYFYIYSWSMWQGAQPNCKLISKEGAIEFTTDKAGLIGVAELTESEAEKAKEFGIDMFNETG